MNRIDQQIEARYPGQLDQIKAYIEILKTDYDRINSLKKIYLKDTI